MKLTPLKCTILRFLIILMLWVPFTLMAQQGKKPVPSQAEYGLWGHLSLKELSSDGNWTSYMMSYDSGKDTLFIAKTNGAMRHAFPGCRNGAFIGNSWYSCLDKDNTLIILTLATGKSLRIDAMASYTMDAPRDRIIVRQKQDNAIDKTIVLSLRDNKRTELPDIQSYLLDPISGRIAYCSRSANTYAVKVLHPEGAATQVVSTGIWPCHNFKWAAGGNKLGFISKDDTEGHQQTKINLFDLESDKLYTFEPDRHPAFGEQLAPLASGIRGFDLSGDGQQLFWTAQYADSLVTTVSDTVQIWHSDDKQLHIMKQYTAATQADVLVSWQPVPDTFSLITDRDYSTWVFDVDKSHALLANSKPYEPSNEFYPTNDYRLTDLKKGRYDALLTGVLSTPWSISFSPGGKYIVYFKDRNWWIYDIDIAEHHCLTRDLPYKFYNTDADIPGEPNAYASPLWTLNDKEVLLYDQYDIWAFDIKTNKTIRLTVGRPENKCYRFPEPQPDNNGKKTLLVDLDRDQVLQVSSGNKTGLALYRKRQAELLFMEEAKISNVIADNGNIVYMQQSFTSPPAIMAMHWKKRKAQLLYQSNSHHKKYSWGSSEIISFSNTQGKSLKGALYYPAGYDPAMTYPMVVHIYDKQSSKQHQYINPSLYNENGFNIANLTSKGYFVLLPDISYQVGNPGKSALDCVTAAVREVIALKHVDPKRIGLIGHSFGGYETDYIITQTDIFAAAVSGAAISDMVSSYLAVSRNNAGPNFHYYESGQLRMGEPLSKDYLGYVNNSPVFYAHQVTTPLLSWCGENDGQVDPSQSFGFYMALRRTNKEHTLLVFPDQGHVITDSMQQQYLTNAIESWFGYYLKGDAKPVWLE